MAASTTAPGMAAPSQLASLKPSLLTSFAPAAVFHNDGNSKIPKEQHGDRKCNSLSFSDSGQFLAATFNDRMLQLVDAHDGTLQGVFSLSRSGAQAVEFTHHQSSVLHAAHHGPNQGPGIISYHCLHTNKILRLFNHHQRPVSSLAMNPGSDQFMSVSLDGVCALWDIRSPNCEYSWSVSAPAAALPSGPNAYYKDGPTGRAAAAFDSTGRVLAAAGVDHTVAMFDARKPSQAFSSRQIASGSHSRIPNAEAHRPLTFSGLAFSPSGRFLAASCLEHGCIVLDSTPKDEDSGDKLQELTVAATHMRADCNTVFSPDDRFLLTGSAKGDVWAYDLQEIPPEPTDDEKAANAFAVTEYQRELAEWVPIGYQLGSSVKSAAPSGKGGEDVAAAATSDLPRHGSAISAVAMHPDRALFASADDSLCVWQPGPNAL